MLMIDMDILTLLFGVVAANLLLKVPFYGATLVKKYFSKFGCAFIYWCEAINASRFTSGLGSIYRALVGFDSGNVSADSMQFGVMSDLIPSWIGFESASGRPTYTRYKTNLIRPTNHLPSVAELRPTRPRTLPDKTDTTPTYNRETTDNLSGRNLSNISVCPNINLHQTDRQNRINTNCKPISSCIWWFFVGLVSVLVFVTGVLVTDSTTTFRVAYLVTMGAGSGMKLEQQRPSREHNPACDEITYPSDLPRISSTYVRPWPRGWTFIGT